MKPSFKFQRIEADGANVIVHVKVRLDTESLLGVIARDFKVALTDPAP